MPEVPTRMGEGSEAEVGTTQGAWPPKTWESWGPPRCSCLAGLRSGPLVRKRQVSYRHCANQKVLAQTLRQHLSHLCPPHPPNSPKDKTRCSAWGMKLLITPAQSGGFVPSLLRWFSEDIPGPMSGHSEVPN